MLIISRDPGDSKNKIRISWIRNKKNIDQLRNTKRNTETMREPGELERKRRGCSMETTEFRKALIKEFRRLNKNIERLLGDK